MIDISTLEKIKRLSNLTDNLRKHTIGYSELIELKNTISELSDKLKERDFDLLMNKLGYLNIDDVYNKLNNFNKLDLANKMKVSNFIGTISGTTMSIQKNAILTYKYKNKKSNK